MEDVKAVLVSVVKEEADEIKEESIEDYKQFDGLIKQESLEDNSVDITELQIKQESLEDFSEDIAEIKQEPPEDCSEINAEIMQEFQEDCCEKNVEQGNFGELGKFFEVVTEIPEEYVMEEEAQPSCGQKCTQSKDIEQLEARVGRLECLLELLVSKVTSSKSKPNTANSSSLAVKKSIIWNNGHPVPSSSLCEANANLLQTNSNQPITKQPAFVVVRKNPISKSPNYLRPKQSVVIVDVNKSGPKSSNSMKPIPGVIATKSISTVPQSLDGNKLAGSTIEMKSSSSIEQSSVLKKIATLTTATKSIPVTLQCSEAKNPESAFNTSLSSSFPAHQQYLHARDFESPVITTKSVSISPPSSNAKKLVPAKVEEKSRQFDSMKSNEKKSDIVDIVKSNNVYQKNSDANKSRFVFDESEPVNLDSCRSELAHAVQSGIFQTVKIALTKQPSFQQVAEALLVASSHSVVRLLCNYYPDIVHSMEASRALFYAAEHGRINILKTLLEAGTYPNARNRNSLTVLHKAASRGHDTCVQILLDHGANISATTNCRCTALHMAAMSGADKCIMVLLKNGAPIDEPDNMGFTALHHAVRCKHHKAIQVLLKSGANAKFENLQGKTPFDLAYINTAHTGKGTGEQGTSVFSKLKKVGRRTKESQPLSSKIPEKHIQASELEPEKKKRKTFDTIRIEMNVQKKIEKKVKQKES